MLCEDWFAQELSNFQNRTKKSVQEFEDN